MYGNNKRKKTEQSHSGAIGAVRTAGVRRPSGKIGAFPMLTLAAVIGLSAAIPAAGLRPTSAQAAAAAADATAFADLSLAGPYRSAMEELLKQHVLEGDGTAELKPTRSATRAELAKIVTLSFGLKAAAAGNAGASFEDVAGDVWYAPYVNVVAQAGLLQGEGGLFHPQASVSVEELVRVMAAASRTDAAALQAAIAGYEPRQAATRAETSQAAVRAQQLQAEAAVRVVSVKALNKLTLQVDFSGPIADLEANLELAARELTFDNGLRIVNVPRLMSGFDSRYIIPVTPQQEGVSYTFSFKGKAAGTFAASGATIALNEARQVTDDTFEVEALQEDGVVDYGYIIKAYAGGRSPLAFALDENNRHEDKAFQIISSMRERVVTITPEGGEPVVASYVPFTQSTDGRQTPKFRLPNGQKLVPGTVYTVTADWATLRDASFTAGATQPLRIASAAPIDAASFSASLSADPLDELFAGRSVVLTADDGSTVTAAYRFQSRKGVVGIFDLPAGQTLQSGAVYQVAPVGDWAVAEQVTLATK
ncbi:S-layer homology domain-containing protein [Paenibacillus cymbidii]|uniref:S-layer homology domain-containing protein n=1 Tax=Paenibacillus cymbidii TaxID=1639034 RepID=UPI0010800067|nr:S-layer homology domain-containing protein [Paenibacillus cymbidii]